ncbi:Rad21-Rec8 domain-containing protein [Fusarium sp. Ph1]|nr:Rad21-Rec8 domain-containing protein [Fusarium sp. Ph1]
MEGRSPAWAPELRGMLSLDAVRGLNELKRKRDSGIADVESDHGASKSPRLVLGEDTEMGLLEIPGDDGGVPPEHLDEKEPGTPMPGFEDTTYPLVHPTESRPVSMGTKHAVHVLRDRFGADAADSPGKRLERAVNFQTSALRR